MNLSIFNFKFLKVPFVRSLIFTFSFLSFYHVLTITRIIKPRDGMNQWQNNFIRLQRYAYQDSSSISLVAAGSSLTANLPITEISPSAINLGMSGGCTQTGIEAVERKSAKPRILLIEINETITRKVDTKTIGSIYNPLLYSIRLYMPMYKEEYQPVGIVLPKFVYVIEKLSEASGLTNRVQPSQPVVNINNNLTQTLISQIIETNKNPLSEAQKTSLKQESEYIKLQISKLIKEGVRVILFDIPREPRVQATVTEKQTRALLKELFPVNSFEWLPEPPPRQWKTNDGIHIVSSDAKDYVAFIKNQVFTNKAK